MGNINHSPQQKHLYLLPAPISANTLLKDYVSEQLLLNIEVFLVEKIKTTRRLIKQSYPNFPIDSKQWIQIAKTNFDIKQSFAELLDSYTQFGLMSEAGCNSVADPGAEIVMMAHNNDIRVKPLLSPNSIILALQSSGLNGQHFVFHGYFPIKAPERKNVLNNITHQAKNIAHIFIETPYRTASLMEYLVANLNKKDYLCLAQDIFGEAEMLKTLTILEWKKHLHLTQNLNSVFIIQKND